MYTTNMMILLEENNMQNYYPKEDKFNKYDRDWLMNVSKMKFISIFLFLSTILFIGSQACPERKV